MNNMNINSAIADTLDIGEYRHREKDRAHRLL